MTRAVILIFLGGSPDAYEAELEAWARARLVQIQTPEASSARARGYSAAIAAQIEQRLEAARLSLAVLDDDAARARLVEAERLLREHPELPQAAWLMAERWELEPTERSRPQPPPEPGFPVWATIALASVGAAAIGGVVAWRAGAFDGPDRDGPRWHFYGP
jgi:hypothetical protein